MSYPIKCCATTLFNMAANVGASFATRYNPDISLQGGKLFAGIAGVTHSICYIAIKTFLDIKILPDKKRFEEESEFKWRALVLTAGSLGWATLITTIATPKIASLIGLVVPYKTAAAFALFNISTTLLSEAIANRKSGGPGNQYQHNNQDQ